MGEFSLIADIVQSLGDRAAGRWVRLGPGDDAAVIHQTAGWDAVASIDTLVEGTHFPANTPPNLLGYRAMMVALSDLAAMAATPRYVLVALTLPDAQHEWVQQLATGMAEAAALCDVYVCGGNLTRGPLSISLSVHGECPQGAAVTRDGACEGEGIYVSAALGGAAACVRNENFLVSSSLALPLKSELTLDQQAYYYPQARFDVVEQLATYASAAIDISDGLLQDLGHIAKASEVGLSVSSKLVPLHRHANLDDALGGGDDYQIACTSAVDIDGFIRIGDVVGLAGARHGSVLLDKQLVQNPNQQKGYDHFGID